MMPGRGRAIPVGAGLYFAPFGRSTEPRKRVSAHPGNNPYRQVPFSRCRSWREESAALSPQRLNSVPSRPAGYPQVSGCALPTRRYAAPCGWVIPLPAHRPFTPLSLLAGDAGLQL